MSNSDYHDLLQELENRKNQYGSIEVKGIICYENGIWKNVVTKIHPRANWETSVPNVYTYNYGNVVIFSRNLSIEGIIKLLEGLKDKKKISLPDLPEYEAPTDLGKGGLPGYGIFNSYREEGGFMFEWPSIFYVTKNQQAMQLDLYSKLISPNLPYYPYLYLAIEKEIGTKSGSSSLGKVIVIVPDYRARIRLILLSGSKIKVQLDTKIEKPENFLGKYYCVTEKEIYQGDVIFEKNEKEIEFQDKIKWINLVLLTREGKIIDWKDLYSRYPIEPGTSVEYTPENIEFIIKGGENEYVEFKREIGEHKEFVESIVAFANRKGGMILLGVDDHCNIIGAIERDLDEKRIYNIIRDNCEPPIETKVKIVEANDKKLVVITVPEGNNKPYLVKNKGPYIRVGSSDRPTTRAELDEFYKPKEKTTQLLVY